MANEPRKGPSWKNPAGPAKGPAPSRKHDWQPTTPAAKSTGKSRRGKLLLAAFCGALLLAAIVIAVLMIGTYKPPATALVPGPTGAGLMLPAGDPQAKAIADLEKWLKEGGDRPRLATGTTLKADDWEKALTGVSEKAVVLYLALHGGADKNDDPYLWVASANASAIEEKDYQKCRLRLSAVLAALGKLPPAKGKLLILDATQVQADWVNGMLHNNFVRALKAMEKQIAAVDNLVVICSSDEDQRSWVSEERGKSIFAHYLLEAQKGSTSRDNVDALQLYGEVSAKVATWVQANRGEKQTVVMLPAGDAGPARARKISISGVAARGYSEPRTEATGAVPQDLVDAWGERDLLATNTPPPQFVAPHLWRRYQDLLLRAEQLWRVGAPYAMVLGEARGLLPALARSPWGTLTSVGNSIAMPHAVGVKPPDKPLSLDDFNRLWSAPEAGERSRAKIWTDLAGQVGGAENGLTWLQRDLVARIYDTLASDRPPTPTNIKIAAQIIQIAFAGSLPPSEAHFLLILDRDLNARVRERPELVPTLALALRTHRLAESVAMCAPAKADQGYPASELVYPWLADEIGKADISRLRGDDLLFSTEPKDWERAAQKLTQAGQDYETIADKANKLRLAVNTRNRVLTELPYLARWVAGLRNEFDDASKVSALLTDVETIATGAHRLGDVLEDGSYEQLTKTDVAGLLRAHEQLIQTFTERIAKLGPEPLPSNWHRLDNALQVPLMPQKTRKALLEHLRHVGGELNAKTGDASSAASSAAATTGPTPQEAAQRQGRMALAALGEPWIMDKPVRDTAPPDAARFSFSELTQRIREPQPGRWWESIQNEVGEQLGWHWRELARETARVAERAKGLELGPAVKSLARADGLARLLDGATALPPAVKPAEDHRRYRLHNFLLAQARRGIDAGWADAGERPNPKLNLPPPESYAERAGSFFVNDAHKLLVPDDNIPPRDKERLLAAVTPTRKALKIALWTVQAARLSVDLIDQDRELKLDYTLTQPANHTPGYPLLHRELSGPVKPPGNDFDGWLPVTNFAEAKTPINSILPFVRVDVDPEAARTTPSGTVTLEVYYRGHLIPAVTKVAMNREPSSVWTYRPPAGPAGFAIRSDGQQAGTVAILLDWSRSMSLSQDDKRTPLRKYQDAVDALGKILEDLPADSIVSLALFGKNDGKGNSPLMLELDARRHDFANNPAKLKELLQRLKSNPADGDYTPLAKAIHETIHPRRGTSVFKNSPGYKTILVLTDGMDTVDKNEVPSPGEIVQKALEGQDISLQMLFFQAGKEEKTALDQFAVIRDLESPGELWAAEDRETLVQHLREAMRPQIQVYRDKKLEPKIHAARRRGMRAVPLGPTLESWSPGLEPALYQLRTTATRLTPVSLEAGDRLLLQLRRAKEGGLEFWPRRYTSEVTPPGRPQLKQASADGLVQLAIARCQLRPRGSAHDLDFLLMMDREFPGASELSLSKPHFAWFEVKTQNRDENPPLPRMLDVENVPYYPAPAWHVRVRNWPGQPGVKNTEQDPARPTVSAWWLEKWPANPQRLTRKTDVSLENSFNGQTVNVKGINVTVQSVAIENRFLVVKMQYPPGKPAVIIQPAGLKDRPEFTLEQEHRFYEKIGVYVARFGSLSRSEEDARFTLEIHALDDIKSAGREVQLNMVDAPSVRELFEPVPQPVKLD